MTKERKAQIARENGAKSKGPITEEGKAKSSQNARKEPTREEMLAKFFPPHSAILCHEEKEQYAALVDELIAIYRPCNQIALAIVRDIAGARWQIDRLQRCLTMQWNNALIDAGNIPSTLTPELRQFQAEVRASSDMLSKNGPLSAFNREIDRLQTSIARLERRLKFVHTNFPNAAPTVEKQTDTPTENTELSTAEAKNNANNEPIYITENIPSVIAAYKAEYPNREIIILPPDNVAKGIDEDDDMPVALRRAA